MSKSKGLRIPYWLLKLLPMWDHICPKCRKEVKQKSHKCIHCGENYGTPVHVPPRMLKDPKILEEYVHKHVFPRVSSLHRAYLTQFFTVLFAHGFEGGNFGNDPLTGFAWTGTNGAPTVVAAPVHHGSWACDLNAHSEGCYYNYVEVVDAYARVYVRLSALAALNNYYALFQFYRQAWEQACDVVVVNDAGTHKWRLRARVGGVLTDYNAVGVDTPVIDTWFCLKLKYAKSAAAGAQLWVNGVSGCTSGITDNYPANQFSLFLYSPLFDETDTYYDCILVADVDIGCEVSAPKGTIAIHAKLVGII